METGKDGWDAYWRTHRRSGYINRTPQILQTVTEWLDLQGQRVLEIGVGTGGNSSALSRWGAQVFVVDFSRTALELAETTAEVYQVRLTLVECDAKELPFPSGAFDLVFHQGFLEHFSSPTPLLREQVRVLAKGGYLLADVPQRYNLYTIHKHYRMWRGHWEYGGWETEFSHRRLRKLMLECGLHPVEAYGRGVFPYLFSLRNQLERLEARLFKSGGLPQGVWQIYDGFWHKLEHSAWGRNTLQCVGILAQKV